MKDERTFTISPTEVLHIIYTHLLQTKVLPEGYYTQGTLTLTPEGYKVVVWRAVAEPKEAEEEKPPRHIDLSTTYLDKEEKKS